MGLLKGCCGAASRRCEGVLQGLFLAGQFIHTTSPATPQGRYEVIDFLLCRAWVMKDSVRRGVNVCHTGICQNSGTGTRARVARVRAEYPNQLDYSGSVLKVVHHINNKHALEGTGREQQNPAV